MVTVMLWSESKGGKKRVVEEMNPKLIEIYNQRR